MSTMYRFLMVVFLCFCLGALLLLHSLPTRRSSDLSRELKRQILEHFHVPGSPVQAFDAIRTQTPVAPLTAARDRKSTRLNSSHLVTSYAVFCVKKKDQTIEDDKVDRIDCELYFSKL